jgi:mannose-6-phosphate isomerase-like protein (cupin superfamily)
MSATEDQVRTGAILNAEEEVQSRTFAHEPGEGEAWWWFGLLATIKATKEQTGGRSSLVEILAPDGYGSVLHVHHQEDEGFYILEGEMTFYVGDQMIRRILARISLAPRTFPTPSRLTRVRRGSCSSSRLRAWRASSGKRESQQSH